MRRLVDAGIRTNVAIAPILPGLSDHPELLAEAESKGYFEAAREGFSVADRVVVAAARQARAEPSAPPSTLSLLRQARDPRTRRALARALTLLQAVGADPSVDAAPPSNEKG